MLECKQKGFLSLNLKVLANRVDDLIIILILQNEMLLLMLFCKRVPVLVFYMAFTKFIERSLTNVCHLDLFYQQLKLPLTI